MEALLKGDWDESQHPRDDRGRFGEGGGGDGAAAKPEGDKGEHPGKGYSKSARLIDGVIHTPSVYDAQRALFEDRKVELSQPKQVSTLIKELGKTAAKMAEQGEQAPVFNLCNVSIQGTNLFCAETLGIPRAEMPVIPAKQTKAFVKHLKSLGYKVEKHSERADHLRATQSEISGAKVAASMKRIKEEGFYKRIVVSRDDYILDGHHTWAGQVGIDIKDGKFDEEKGVKVYRVDISITKLIAEADKWTKEEGIAKKPASEKPKSFRQMTIAQAASELPPSLFRKYYTTVQRFFAANAHLHRNINDVVIVVRDWDESQHPRVPAGGPGGGQFGEGGGGGGSGEAVKPEESVKLDPKVVQVGGDEWNKATAAKLEREYQEARPLLDSLTKNAVAQSAVMAEPTEPTAADWTDLPPEAKDEVYSTWKEENKLSSSEAGEQWAAMSDEARAEVAIAQGITVDEKEEEEEPLELYPESWDEIPDQQQQEIEDAYVEQMTPKFFDDEQQNWYDSGGALADAKNQLAWDFTKQQSWEWAQDAIETVQKDREAEGKTPLPFEFPNQILNNMTVEYSSDTGEGTEDPDIKFDDKGLDEEKVIGVDPTQQMLPGMEELKPSERLTPEMRDELIAQLTADFNKKADDLSGSMEAPEYLKDSASEYAGEYFGQMDDKEKFDWAYKNDKVDKPESEKQDAPPEEATTVEALPTKFDPLNETSGADYKRTQKLARYLSVTRANEIIVERGLRKTAADVGRLRQIDKTLWEAWKGSSTSQNGMLLQVATAEELGGRLNTKTATSIPVNDLKAFADHRYADIGGYAGVKAYLRAKWETTQYLLERAGTQELELYRGIDLKRADPDRFAQALKEKSVSKQIVTEAGVKYEKLPTVKVDRNGAASTTTDPHIANGWKGENTVVLRTLVPRTAAVSIPAYGINIHSEHEVVIAGTAWKAWDAWHGRAPGFPLVPIGAHGTGVGISAPKLAA